MLTGVVHCLTKVGRLVVLEWAIRVDLVMTREVCRTGLLHVACSDFCLPFSAVQYMTWLAESVGKITAKHIFAGSV